MRTFLWICAIVAVAATLHCSPPASQPPNQEAEHGAIMEAFNGLLAASEAGDVEGYLSFITEDAVMMYAGQAAVVGHEAVRPFVTDFFQQYDFEFTQWESEEIQIAGDWAFHRYSGVAVMTPKAGGDPVRFDRKYIDILRKEGSSWRTSHHIFNLNH